MTLIKTAVATAFLAGSAFLTLPVIAGEAPAAPPAAKAPAAHAAPADAAKAAAGQTAAAANCAKLSDPKAKDECVKKAQTAAGNAASAPKPN